MVVLRLAGARRFVWAKVAVVMAKVTSSERASNQKECGAVVVVMHKGDLMWKGIERVIENSLLVMNDQV